MGIKAKEMVVMVAKWMAAKEMVAKWMVVKWVAGKEMDGTKAKEMVMTHGLTPGQRYNNGWHDWRDPENPNGPPGPSCFGANPLDGGGEAEGDGMDEDDEAPTPPVPPDFRLDDLDDGNEPGG